MLPKNRQSSTNYHAQAVAQGVGATGAGGTRAGERPPEAVRYADQAGRGVGQDLQGMEVAWSAVCISSKLAREAARGKSA